MNEHIPNLRPVAAFVTAGSLLFLGACMVGPEYRRPVAPETSGFREALPDGWSSAQPSDGALRTAWWEIYNDPQLNGLEQQVSITNQNVIAAEARFREAKAAVRGARASELPAVTALPAATASGTNAASNVQHRSFQIPIDAVWQADVWGSIRRSIAANAAVAQASAADLENARLLYQSQLAVDYFQIQGLDAEQQLLDTAVKSYEQYVQLTRDRFNGGVASMADVALAETQLETARVQLTDLQIQRAELEHAIAVLAGKPPSTLSISTMASQSPPPSTLAGIPSRLLERRPDIAATERQVAAANEQIGIAKAALYPSLTLSATGGSQTTVFDDLLSVPTRFWSVGPQLVETLFDAGKRKAQVAQARAAYDSTVADYRQTVLVAFQQVEDSLAELRVLAEETDVANRAVAAAKQTLDLSTIQYRGGLTNYLQVIIAQTSALQSQRAAVQILTRRNVASVLLIEALGGGWDTSQLPSVKEVRG
jgi:NodT family efflux transporter outer membrane factor (OMF) lipoprotein